MYAKVLIKFYVLIFCINFALAGVILDKAVLVGLGLINMIALFFILFQHKSLFKHIPLQGKRVLFSADVFVFIAIWFGITCAYGLFDQFASSISSFGMLALISGGFFYIACLRLFRMVKSNYWSHWSINILAGLLLVVFLFAEGLWIRTLYADALIEMAQYTQQQVVSSRDSLFTQRKKIVLEDDIMIDDDDILIGEDNVINVHADETVLDEGIINNTIFSDGTLSGEELTYGNFLPVLADVYEWEDVGSRINFNWVSSSNALYPIFAQAYAKRMIGSSTSPQTQILCRNLMVLLGLAEGRDLQYSSANIFDIFRQEANQRGYITDGCSDGFSVAKGDYLP